MIIRTNCIGCGAIIHTVPSRLKDGKAKYCSRQCRNEAASDPTIFAPRFWAKIGMGAVNDCWEWKGLRAPYHAKTGAVRGYGLFSISKNGKRRMAYAHRLAFLLATGIEPVGLLVCHRCDNPPCCNPSHLFLGTPADNTADMDAKGRRRSLVRPGYLNPNARLSISQVLEIRQRHEAGESQTALGLRYSVSQVQVGQIVNRKSWTNV